MGSYNPWESVRFLPLLFAFFGLLLTIKPYNEVKVKLKLGHMLNLNDWPLGDQ
jgi:hypothetical protein